jgi:3-oxoadipate CoA-transferase beta subunit
LKPLSRNQIAWRVAQDIPDGNVVNLGLGMPVLVSNYIPSNRDIFLQSENGILGVGPEADESNINSNLVDAGSRKVTLRTGASLFDSASSFAMIRGGHIDVTILGAFEVSASGDLANWDSRIPDKGPLVGGAMDLAVGAKSTWTMMQHNTKDGSARLLKACSLPLTAPNCVNRVYTDIAVIEVINSCFITLELIDTISEEGLKARTDGPISLAPNCKILKAPTEIV